VAGRQGFFLSPPWGTRLARRSLFLLRGQNPTRLDGYDAMRHATVYVEGTASLPLANDDYPVKRTDFCEGQFVHARLLRASYTRRVGWPTQ
jgi:hypothetical protein